MNKRLLITDLDGTLLCNKGTLSIENRRALEKARSQSSTCVVATGRSLYSAEKVISSDFPIDYLVTSSGGAIYTWPDKKLLWHEAFSLEESNSISHFLLKEELSFMRHLPCPDNHHFYYSNPKSPPADFLRRLEIYKDFCFDLKASNPQNLLASQFLVIFNESPREINVTRFSKAMNGVTLIKTTSPLDHKSTWVEIFPKAVSKSKASEFLRNLLSIEKKNTFAIGNDYNDSDLLEWAEHAYVVGNAPSELIQKFKAVQTNTEGGVGSAITHFLGLDF